MINSSSWAPQSVRAALPWLVNTKTMSEIPIARYQMTQKRSTSFIRAGKGPYFLEIKTYRYRGHSVSDPAKYRTKEELAHYKDSDPITVTEKKIVSNKIASQKEIDAIKDKIKAEIAEAAEFAENSPLPDAQGLSLIHI